MGEKIDHAGGFDHLMRRRVHEVLVLASPYDGFVIEEGGRLTELILSEYISLNLTEAPHVTRATDAAQALRLLETKSFDLVFTMLRVGGMDGLRFAREAKALRPTLKVVLLAFDAGEFGEISTLGAPTPIDHVFTWSGDATLFLAVIKLVEDLWNVEADTELAQVRIILLVEDSVAFASRYLPILYTELVAQTQSILDDSYNVSQRLLRMRARPKVLWTQSYEEALGIYERYRRYVLGVISDLSFPRGFAMDPRAGVSLIERLKQDDPTMPILLQSSQIEAERIASDLGVDFINKRSRKLERRMRRFLAEKFGFGEFVFRMPDGREWGRAHNIREMEDLLRKVPDLSLEWHALRNDFSNWLRARTEFDLAKHIRPRRVSEFENIGQLRSYLLGAFHLNRAEAQRGVIIDFSPQRYDEQSLFVRLGKGSLGGKGRGLGFAYSMLQNEDLAAEFPSVVVSVPRTAVICTDVFDEFLLRNDLLDIAYSSDDDQQVEELFTQAKLPTAIVEHLRAYLDRMRMPLAVRSSSLLEDSQSQPFAGIYRTYMLPNRHPDREVRLAEICRAIQLVYASTFMRESKAYIESTPYRIEDEKMAVILQEIVGSPHGDRFYPEISGVARSYNYYPIAPMAAEDGLAVVALGLGRQVVGGYQTLRFCPAHPLHIPQFGSVEDTLDTSQRRFFALDLTQTPVASREESANLLELELTDALSDGTLGLLASSYSPQNQAIYDGLSRGGPVVLTFAPLLKSGEPPLAAVIRRLLSIGEEGLGNPVEMEFAMDLTRKPAWFGFLQIRRLIAGGEPDDVRIDSIHLDEALCMSPSALGNGQIEHLYDLVFVRPDSFDRAQTRAIAARIGQVNESLRASARPYVLIGPGRWGSADPWLGIPVRWDQINGARLIVEAALEGFRVEPSQGTHFFQNMTALKIGYFTVNPFAGNGWLHWDRLPGIGRVVSDGGVCHVRCERPLRVRIDGRRGQGVLLPPEPEPQSLA